MDIKYLPLQDFFLIHREGIVDVPEGLGTRIGLLLLHSCADGLYYELKLCFVSVSLGELGEGVDMGGVLGFILFLRMTKPFYNLVQSKAYIISC